MNLLITGDTPNSQNDSPSCASELPRCTGEIWEVWWGIGGSNFRLLSKLTNVLTVTCIPAYLNLISSPTLRWHSVNFQPQPLAAIIRTKKVWSCIIAILHKPLGLTTQDDTLSIFKSNCMLLFLTFIISMHQLNHSYWFCTGIIHHVIVGCARVYNTVRNFYTSMAHLFNCLCLCLNPFRTHITQLYFPNHWENWIVDPPNSTSLNFCNAVAQG